VRRIPPIVIAVAFVMLLGVMPARWVAPWSSDLSAVLWVPLSPLAHAGTSVRLWLRPGHGAPREADASVVEERDRYRGLWHAEQIKVQELEERLRAYEVAAKTARDGNAKFAAASVLTRSSSGGGFALKLNCGSRQGIAAGDVVLFGGDAIVGRIAPEVGNVTSTVMSVADRASGRVDAYITPAAQEGAKRFESISVQIVPDGRGQLRADIDLGSAVAAGDMVRVRDPAWPQGAQGMRIGVVREVRRKDAQPLRGEAIIDPVVDGSRVGEVVVRVSNGGAP